MREIGRCVWEDAIGSLAMQGDRLAVFGRWRRPWLSGIAVVLASVILVMAVPSQAAAPSSAGQVYAFGINVYGQLGSATNVETTIANPTPALVSLPGASGPVTQIAASAHSLALTSTGQLYAFGYNNVGQLGSTTNNGTSKANSSPTLVTLPGASGSITQVAAGGEHSLAVTSAGQLYAFGSNFVGQLGLAANVETVKANPTPSPVGLPGVTGPVTEIAAGAAHSLALTSTGQLYAFGSNTYGQLGIATNSETGKPNPTPALVSLPGASGPVTQIAAGGYHSFALTATGQLYAFGLNLYGELGSTTNIETTKANATPALVGLPGASGPVTQIAGGLLHSLVVTSTGQLYAFGFNFYGQLGSTTNNGTGKANPTPTLVTLPGASGAVTQLAAGQEHSLAVTSTGQLYGFGSNAYGQLGSATNSGTGNPNPTPALAALPAGTTIDTVARGPNGYHALALVADIAVLTGTLPAGQVGVPYSTGAQASGGATPYAWTASGLPAGLSINAGSGQITGTPTTAGSSNVVLTVTDAYGITATSPTIPVSIAPTPIAVKTKPPPPVFSNAYLTNKRFRVGGKDTAISARRAPVGTSFRFTLSAAASVQIKITRSAAGLRRGRSCVAPTTKLRRAHAKRCTRTLTVGTLTRSKTPNGKGRIAFSGRIGHRALSPRSYKAVLSASNAGGRSTPVTLSFTVVR
jgi:alpha-tubulin suppressor-like RCC1 family protein